MSAMYRPIGEAVLQSMSRLNSSFLQLCVTLHYITMHCRSSHVVKHYKITVENGDLVLGQDRFSNLESLEEHFDSHPILGDENGKLLRSLIHAQ